MRARAEPVDADPARQLRDPRPHRVVVPERAEPLVDAGEDVLEDVLGVLLAEAEALHRDRVDVAREALDQLTPGVVVARAAACDERGVGGLVRAQLCAARSRLAIVSRSFHAIPAFPSTRGRNSQDVSPQQRSSLSAVTVALLPPSSISAISPK